VLQPSVFWVVLDAQEPDRGTITAVVPPQPGETIQLNDGTACVVNRVGPAPGGSHVVKGTIYVTLA
jgi:hypothetical protein